MILDRPHNKHLKLSGRPGAADQGRVCAAPTQKRYVASTCGSRIQRWQ